VTGVWCLVAGAGQVADQEGELRPEDLKPEVVDDEGTIPGRRFEVGKGLRRDENECCDTGVCVH
jgi:hypothetical protein